MKYGGFYRVIKRTNYLGVIRYIVQVMKEGCWEDTGSYNTLEVAKEDAERKYKYRMSHTYYPDEIIEE